MKNHKFIENVELSMVKSAIVNYNDHLEKGHVAVVAWGNGEGYDVDLNDNVRFGITHTQLDALKVAVKRLNAV